MLCFEHTLHSAGGVDKTIRIVHGDLCAVEEPVDIVVCSAFKGEYSPTPRTLIGSLLRQRSISVQALALQPEMDLRQMGGWLSRETGTNFRRIACVELVDWSHLMNPELMNATVLKKAFSTMRFLLEQASLCGVRVETVALPLLGTGNQGLEPSLVAVPLLSQCMLALESIPELRTITFYERDEAKAAMVARTLKDLTAPIAAPDAPSIFVSYSSRNADIALRMRNALNQCGLQCWMAPDSIPSGSSYQEAIPLALSRTAAVALLLTPEAVASRWVSKEIGVAIGKGQHILPYQPAPFELNDTFSFLLDGEQIYHAWYEPEERRMPELGNRMCRLIGTGK